MRRFLPILLAAGVAGIGQVHAAESVTRPNVLLIISDDLNTDLGCYGHPQVKTPNIDRLASQAALFQHAYCQYPLCGPSRASLLSGRRPHRTGITTNRDKLRDALPDAVMLPQLFKQGGYFTARVGKVYHYAVPQDIGQDGDDDPDSWVERVNPKGRDVTDEESIFSLIPGQLSGTLSWLAADGEDAEQTDGMVAAETIRLLREHHQQPFFIAAGLFRPHTPFVAPRKYFDWYPVDQIPVPPDATEEMSAGPAAAYDSAKPEQSAMSDTLRREAIQAYWASISFVDAQVGLILDEVERLGLAEDTIVVFLSDHGYHLGDHGLWQKASLFEQVARVPLIIRQPKAPANGSQVSAIVELIDLYPTLAAACGLELPPDLDGRSLEPFLQDPDAPSLKAAITQMQRNKDLGVGYIKDPEKRPPIQKDFDGFSLRTDRFRYTEWDETRRGVQLFDLVVDPEETRNLAGIPAYESIVVELQDVLRRELKSGTPAAAAAATP